MTEFIITCQSELQKDGSYKIERYRELVRCKDCKRGARLERTGMTPLVTCKGEDHELNWFCADGVKRDE